MAHIRGEMHWHSRAEAGKVLPQSQEGGFALGLAEPMTLAKRYIQGVFKNVGDEDVSLQPQSSDAEDGTYTDIGSPTVVKAKCEKLMEIAVPAGATHWRIEGTGDSSGVVSWVEAEGSHANAGLP